jgi:hypothetical protein
MYFLFVFKLNPYTLQRNNFFLIFLYYNSYNINYDKVIYIQISLKIQQQNLKELLLLSFIY